MKLVILTVAAAGIGLAQPFPLTPPPALSQLRPFLQLTEGQARQILTNNEEFNRWAGDKQERIFNVQQEINTEYEREQIDAAALGVRYAEIALICREVGRRIPEFQKRNRDVLTDAQRTRLKVIDEAIALMPAINEAQAANLAGTSPNGGWWFLSDGSAGWLAGFLTSGSCPVGASYGPPFPSSVRPQVTRRR